MTYANNFTNNRPGFGPNSSLNNRSLTNELRFAYRVRQALNESANDLPAARLEQIAAARKAALRAHNHGKPLAQWVTRPAFASGGEIVMPSGFAGPGSGKNVGRAGFAVILAMLLVGTIIGLYQSEQQRHAEELAEIDAAVLADELPISAYADHGFNTFLKQNQ